MKPFLDSILYLSTETYLLEIVTVMVLSFGGLILLNLSDEWKANIMISLLYGFTVCFAAQKPYIFMAYGFILVIYTAVKTQKELSAGDG